MNHEKRFGLVILAPAFVFAEAADVQADDTICPPGLFYSTAERSHLGN